MFEVRGIPILTDEIEVLYKLRDDVAERTGREILRKIKRTGDNIMICCPQHKDGQEKSPSCGIYLRRIKDKAPGTVHCFTCGYVDSLEGMISKCFGYNEDNSYGIQWLIENFIGDVEEYQRPEIPFDFSRGLSLPKKVNYVSEEELASYRFYHPYMYQRKLTNEVIERYDVGYQKDFRLVTKNDDGSEKIWNPVEVLTFPVKDINGNCLFVSRRAIYNKNFFLPQNIDKPVYGIYELPKDCRKVVICESVINALTCVSYGVPAVALFGTGNKTQLEQLNSLPIRHYILGLDPDQAGERGTLKLKKFLRGKVLSKLILPKGKDINDLSYEEFINLPSIYI